MHMADALLSPVVGAGFWTATAVTIGYASKRLKKNLEEKMVPLMGVFGAFIFAAQMINFTIPGTGSSGHLGGGMILAIILGPHAAFLTIASVLTAQALFFADGGLLALGCNIWNLGAYPCFIAYPLIYRPLAGDGRNIRRIFLASLLGAVLSLQMGAFSVVMQTLLSGRSELPVGAFLLLMQPIHLAVGIVEGLVTAGVINYVRHARPEILESAAESRPLASGLPMKKILAVFILLAVVSGGILSLFASAYPDGLEWSIVKIYGRADVPGQERGIVPVMEDLQKKTSFLPDYGSGGQKQKEAAASRPGVDAGRSAAGVIGAGMVFGIIVIAGIAVRALQDKKRVKTKPR